MNKGNVLRGAKEFFFTFLRIWKYLFSAITTLHKLHASKINYKEDNRYLCGTEREGEEMKRIAYSLIFIGVDSQSLF